MPRTARCLCGDFSVVVSAEPVMVNVCHCEDCQRRSGVPWSSAAYFPSDSVRLDGPNKIYTRTSDAGADQSLFLPDLRGHRVLGPRDRRHTIRNPRWRLHRSVIPRAIAVGLGKATLRVVADNRKSGALGHAAAAALSGAAQLCGKFSLM